MTHVFRFLTLNITGFESNVKFQMLQNFLQINAIDIAFIQEVVVDNFSIISNFDSYVNIGRDGRGTAFLARKGINIQDIRLHPNGRIISGKIENGKILIVNAYGPSGSQKRHQRNLFYTQELTKHIAEARDNATGILLAGDFNAITNKSDSRNGITPVHPPLCNLLQALSLHDVAHTLRVPLPHYTYIRQHTASRIDRFYHNNNIKELLLTYEVIPVAFTDHHGVILTTKLNIKTFRFGKSFWKLNTNTFQFTNIDEIFNTQWNIWKSHVNKFDNILLWWTLYAKNKIKQFFKNIAYTMAEGHRETIAFYETVLLDLKNQADQNNQNYDKIQDVKKIIQDIHARKFQDKRKVNKVFDTLKGEKYSIYELGESIKRQNKTYIRSMKKTEGEVLSTTKEILAYCTSYYNNIYKREDTNAQAQFTFINAVKRTIDEKKKTKLVEEVSNEEIHQIIKLLPKHKSPGIDGIGYEFYTRFWHIIEEMFCEVIRYILKNAILHETQKEGIIVLIPKKGNSVEIGNFRPISLLCADYKIVTRVIAKKFETCLEEILGDEQTCTVPGNSIINGLMILRDTQRIFENNSQSAALCSLDFEKAFDRIDHNFLIRILQAYGFPTLAIQWIRMITENSTSRLQINGHIGKTISINRGTRQGCPLSMILFTLGIDPLLRILSSNLQGITNPTSKFAVTAYADDITILLRNNGDISFLLNILQTFSQASGEKINWKKSHLLPLNKTSTKTFSTVPFVAKDELRILGIYFSSSTVKTAIQTWKHTIDDIRRTLQTFGNRQLNLLERVNVLNIYGLAKMYFVGQILPLPNQYAAQIAKYIGWFLWKSHLFRAKREEVYLPIRKGGLGLTNHQEKCKALFHMRCMKIYEGNRRQNVEIFDKAWDKSKNTPHIYDTYFRELEQTIGIIPPDLQTTAKNLYLFNTNRYNITPKIKQNHPYIQWEIAWGLIANNLLSTEVRATIYMVINDLIATKHRRHGIRLEENSICDICDKPDTIQHRIAECTYSRTVYRWTKNKIRIITNDNVLDGDILNATVYSNCTIKNRAVGWLIGHLFLFIVNTVPPFPLQQYVQFLRTERHKIDGNVLKTLYGKHLYGF